MPAATMTEDFDSEEDLDLILLVVTVNGFNSLSRKGVLWTVRHRLSRGVLGIAWQVYLDLECGADISR